jgi:hypothetical protein
MTIDQLRQAQEEFTTTRVNRAGIFKARGRYDKDSGLYASLSAQERILNELERAKFNYLMLSIDEFKANMIDEFQARARKVYDRWGDQDTDTDGEGETYD